MIETLKTIFLTTWFIAGIAFGIIFIAIMVDTFKNGEWKKDKNDK